MLSPQNVFRIAKIKNATDSGVKEHHNHRLGDAGSHPHTDANAPKPIVLVPKTVELHTAILNRIGPRKHRKDAILAVELRIPSQTGHRFHRKSATDSTAM
jgi:hypothetical protein